MQKQTIMNAPSRAIAGLALMLVATTLLSSAGCKSINEPNTEKATSAVKQEAIQATLSVDASSALDPGSPGGSSLSPTSTAIVPGKAWPAKVATFAKNFKGPVWYPTYVPKGMKVDSLDVVELDPGSGLICDIVFYDGKNPLMFTQGSPKSRTYQIVSVGKVPWGTDTADVVHEDPSDTTTAKMIVYTKDGNLAELSGVVDFETLKKVAASMMPVR
jgi:hypothetical protein